VWCGVLSLVTTSLVLTFSCYIWQVIFMPTFCKMNLENVPLQTRWQMYYQHDRAQSHSSQVVRQYLNHKFPNWWIGHGSAQNWSPWSMDLNPLDYRVWGYMKAMVYAYKLNTREELVQWILRTGRSLNNAAVLCKVTGSLVTRDKIYPSRWRTLRTTCLITEWRICNCTFNNISQ
jgi:hypothetical protein